MTVLVREQSDRDVSRQKLTSLKAHAKDSTRVNKRRAEYKQGG